MQAPELFPIKHTPIDRHGWSEDSPLARATWMRLREEDEECKGITWYGVGITIHSVEKVTLHIFDMADNVFGGIGDEIFSTDVTRFTLREEMLMLEMISNKKRLLAELEYTRRQNQARVDAIDAIEKELFGE